MKSAVQAKTLRSVSALSSIPTGDVVEDSCAMEVSDDDPQLNRGLGPDMTDDSERTKNKLRLSEVDSGILMEEVEDDSTVGQAAWRKVSSQGANIKQESSVTPAKPSQTESTSSNHDAQTYHVQFVTVSSQGKVETLPENSSDGSSRVPMMSYSLTAASCGKMKNRASEFDVADVKESPDVKIESVMLRKETKQQYSEKKPARDEVDQQQRCAPSRSRYTDSNNDTGNVVGGNSDDEIVICPLAADEPASAYNLMAGTVVLHCDVCHVIHQLLLRLN